MKNLLCHLWLLFIVFSSCSNANSKEYQLKGTIEKHPDRWIFLEKFTQNSIVKFDSVKTDNKGNFVIQKKVSVKDFYRMSIDPNNMVFIVLDPSENITYVNQGISLQEKYDLQGSEEGSLILKIKDFKLKIQQFGDSLNKVFSGLASDQQSLALAGLQNEYGKFMTDQHKKLMELIDKNSDKLAILSASELIDPEGDFPDYEKLAGYLEKNYAYSVLASQVINRCKQLKRTAVGQIAPEINLPDPEGNKIPLSSLRGKIVLIDFWASWCGPCRKENPSVVRAYNKYKDKGFEVYSVSLDKDKNNWKNAIKMDGLPWKSHVSDLGYWNSSVVSLYGFNGIPYTVLIDKDGKILNKGLRGEKLEERLEGLLK